MEWQENEVLRCIRQRRSIRRFEARQLEEDVLEAILEAGLYAPGTGGRDGRILRV